jgi:chromosome segregation ATPase
MIAMDINWIEIIGGVLGTLVGWEGLRYLLNLRTNRRKEEFALLKEQLEFCQQQLNEKEERFVSQTERLRHAQDDLFELMKKHAQVELELQKYRCVVPKCQKREPQNGY